MGAEELGSTARAAGREAEESATLDHAVRVGLVSYGVVHLLLAWLMLQLALGTRSADVSTSGALHELAGDAFGRVLLVVLAGGFAALVLWQLLDALVGHRQEHGMRRWFRRAVSLGRAVIYGALAVSAAKIAVGAGSAGGGTRPDTITARLMEVPYGRLLVAATARGRWASCWSGCCSCGPR